MYIVYVYEMMWVCLFHHNSGTPRAISTNLGTHHMTYYPEKYCGGKKFKLKTPSPNYQLRIGK